MMTLIIEDLELDAELDKEAMMTILGGRKSTLGGPMTSLIANHKCSQNQKALFTSFNTRTQNMIS